MINSMFFDELYKQFSWFDFLFTPAIKNCSDEFFYDGFEYKLMSISTNMNVLSQNETFFVTKIKINQKIASIKTDGGTCPQCGGKLIMRKGKYGSFIGCSNFPRCRYTKNI